MYSSLQIKPLDSGSKKHPLKFPHLPNPAKGFRLCCIASSHSGKTTTICNMLLNEAFQYRSYYTPQKQHYPNIFIISPTCKDDPIWKRTIRELKLPTSHISTEYSDELVAKIRVYSKKAGGGLLILDDLIANQSAMNSQKTTGVTEAFISGRHHLLSVILISQIANKIPNGVRANTTNLMCWRLQNAAQERVFLDEFMVGVENAKEKYMFATRGSQYDFLYVDIPSRKCYCNFTKCLT